MAHAIGARFHIAHGRANAILLPHVLRYNAALPTKFMPAPGYTTYVAPEKYAQMGRILFGGRAEEERASASSTRSTNWSDEVGHASLAEGRRRTGDRVPGCAAGRHDGRLSPT